MALVGCGRWGRHILRDLVSLGCDVPVVARSPASRRRAREGGASAVVDEVCGLPTLDGAVVATPTETHAAVVGELLDREIPLYVEKPLTEDATTAARLAEAAGDRLFVMHKWRYHRGIEALAGIAHSGDLGRLRGVRSTRVGWGNPHHGVDAIWILAPHDLSIVLALLGTIPRPRWAVAEHVGSKPTGLVGALGEDPWAVIEVSVSHVIRRREVRVVGSEGVALLSDAYSDHVTIIRDDPHVELGIGGAEERPIATELPLLRELRAFVEHLSGGPAPLSSAAEGVAEVVTLQELRRLAGADRSSE